MRMRKGIVCKDNLSSGTELVVNFEKTSMGIYFNSTRSMH